MKNKKGNTGKPKGANKEKKRNYLFDLVSMTSISGVDFRKAAELYIALKISTVEELYKACKENKIAALDGWGEASQQKVKSQIELNVLWMSGQCNKVKKEFNSPFQKPIMEKDFLLNLANELSKNLKE